MPEEHRKSVMDEQICDRRDRLLGRSSNADLWRWRAINPPEWWRCTRQEVERRRRTRGNSSFRPHDVPEVIDVIDNGASTRTCSGLGSTVNGHGLEGDAVVSARMVTVRSWVLHDVTFQQFSPSGTLSAGVNGWPPEPFRRGPGR
jgi:hypothetical protein